MAEGRHHTNGYYQALTRKLVLIIIAVSLAPLLLVSTLILEQFRQSYRIRVHAHLQELVQKHKQIIDSFLMEKLSNIRFLAGNHTYGELRDPEFLQKCLLNLRQEYGPVFEDLGVIDERGVQIAYAGPFELTRAHYADAAWFKAAMGQRHFISDVFLGLRGLPHFIVAVRQDGPRGGWILRATIDFMAFNTLVENMRIGDTGFAFILNSSGEFQTKPRFDIVSSQDLSRTFLPGTPNGGDTMVAEKIGPSGRKKVYVAGFMKNGDWLMVYQQEAAEVYASLKRAQGMALVIFLFGGLGIVVTALVLSRRTVSRIARSDREKEMMNQQVIETGKLASLGELAAGIAHEINNPVAIMVEEAGWIEDLLEEEEFKPSENLSEFRRSLSQIRAQGRRCKEITHKLLSFARKTDAVAKDIQLNEVVEEVVSLSAQRARYSNVKLTCDLADGLPTVRVSQSEMQQVLFNLVNNALDAMEKTGGEITVTTRRAEASLRIEVADNGPGIPSVILGRIFDPFFTTKPVGKGTGLGLSICYGIIRKLGGTIDVKSVLDHGTRFTIHIPVSEAAVLEEEIGKECHMNN